MREAHILRKHYLVKNNNSLKKICTLNMNIELDILLEDSKIHIRSRQTDSYTTRQ